MNLQNLSLSDLRKLLADVQNAIKVREQDELKKARQEIMSIAERVGLPLNSLLAAAATKRPAGQVAVKYRHPENASQQWTGRGRQPKWVKEHLEGGGTMEKLEVK